MTQSPKISFSLSIFYHVQKNAYKIQYYFAKYLPLTDCAVLQMTYCLHNAATEKAEGH